MLLDGLAGSHGNPGGLAGPGGASQAAKAGRGRGAGGAGGGAGAGAAAWPQPAGPRRGGRRYQDPGWLQGDPREAGRPAEEKGTDSKQRN